MGMLLAMLLVTASAAGIAGGAWTGVELGLAGNIGGHGLTDTGCRRRQRVASRCRLFGRRGTWLQADYWIQIIAHSKFQSPNGTNSGYYSNPQVDELFDKAAAELDDAARRGLYQQAQGIIMHEDADYIPISFDRAPLALSTRVKGFVNPPEDWFQLWTVSVE